ncbi:hypothetical protein NA57DRAFT_76902 [Rhizodiscina lignyota]|uniref:Uncharacterized protein n=1 Tax=Rhizodiscina lignyota TaxID=1504668 RepID=A0A9P4IEC5_9PEZI|nr:hypothetical protein NA57DRAFT_76902 [Rhizodiscina lignyota]
MASQLLLVEELVPVDALGLGGLVQSLKNPIMDAYSPKPPLPSDAVLLTSVNSFQSRISSTQSKSFRLAVTRLLSAAYNIEHGGDVQLRSINVNRYQLRQPKEVFRRLCLEDETARQWLNAGIQSCNKSFLIVEMHTAKNAAITWTERKSRQHHSDLTVPVSTIATGGMDVLGFGGSLDSGGGVSYSSSNDNQKTLVVEGESIYAIGYKRIVWKSWGLRRKEIDRAMLDNEITWSILGQRRGQEEEEEQISVDLSDDLDTEDVAGVKMEADEDDVDAVDDVAELSKRKIEVEGSIYLICSEADEE